MGAAVSPGVRRGGVPPVVAARWALWTFVLVNLVIVEILFVTAGTGKNSVLTVAKFFGLHAAVLMMFQLLLVARLPWLDRRIGMDRLTVWHRWVGFTLLWTILTHAVLVVLGYAHLEDTSMTKTFFALAGVPASLLGMWAAAFVVVAAAVSVRRVRRRLPYETWHGLHLLLYLALGLAFVHQLQETTTFNSSAAAGIYWWALWLFAFGSLVTARLVVPVWRNLYHRFRVVAVVPESDDVVSVHVSGRHLDRLPARAGQFCFWRFPGHNHWWLANPFSLSTAPDGRALRLTAKAAGGASAGLRHLPVGSRVFVEGPYGAFTSLHRTRPGALLIAGGVGITPVRALLEEEPAGDVVVLYRVRSERDAVLLGEIRALVAARGGRLYLLTGRRGEGRPPFEPESLSALVPDIAERDVYVCGPPAMTSAVLSGLRALKVPRRQVHAERFGLA
ncbi:ferredoxin reductase family protein [Streptomyces stelliscabiei]|uniref:ferredoxin reductase family protein n=1 Tax=Streptomyces stelliscabiei TaxID=146820 RepID=UPI0029A72F0B|nr:ferredoxin reductase family protein [Streptomyces stelliscabiei]MDX2553151.1 ferredoxin reductase family protein [Streptomyces stelliscabiei]MDX2612139.1 ferredoxin reductase family protein [Streptomyces stelliscabiei]MDX2636477.1 ferredoxin reductase family protein [Streptomyces stelliscabiei]MDX2663228.1 ferredoxin reductase family protein [Streptomyces stelliscabiei]MDX2714323.1 ferredoxin reductase family protein [Streptomyces stelliscabiei]